MDSGDDPTVQPVTHSRRRRFLQALGAAGLVGAAGCLGGDDDGEDENGDDDGENGNGNGDGGEAVFEVSGLDPADAEVEQGESLEVSATITNTGDAEGTQTVEYRVEGDALGSEDLTLEGVSEADVSFTVETDDLEEGEHTHGVYTEDAEETGTLTIDSGIDLGDDPDGLLSFDDVSDGAVNVMSGANTISGEVDNSYGFEIQDVEVSLEAPDGWEVEAVGETAFDSIDAYDSEPVEWELTVPDDAEGEDDLTAQVTYAADDQEADVTVTQTVSVVEALSLPYGLNAGGISSANEDYESGDAVEYNGVEFEPYNEEIDPHPAVSLVGAHNGSGSNEEGFEIEGTDADAIYQTMMWGDGELGYEIMVPNGTYDVTFHIAEIFFDEEAEEDSQRTFSGRVNGEPAFEELETWDSPLQAMPQTIEGVEVEGGPMVIELESSVENPMVNGIEIHEADGGGGDQLSAPYGLNAGGPSDDPSATVEVDGVEFEPYNDEIDPHPAISLTGSEHSTSGASGEGFDIEGTDADELYQSMMWAEDEMGYEIDIEPGTYEVTFHLAEIWLGEDAGSGEDPNPDPAEDEVRIYSAWVNDEQVFEDLNLWDEFGELVAHTESVEVEVDGTMEIWLESSSENPMANAIEIREA